MNPPTVLLDATFIDAMVDPAAAQHGAAALIYARLVDQYRNEQVLLVATTPALQSLPRDVRRSLLAPVASVHVAPRHRWAARRVDSASTSDTTNTIDDDTEFATLLVLLHREKVDRVASFDTRFAAVHITVESLQGVAVPSTDGSDDDQSNAA